MGLTIDLATLLVRLRAKDENVKDTLKDSEQQGFQWQRAMETAVGVGAERIFSRAAEAVKQFVVDSVQAAGDVAEQYSKFQVVFKETAGNVESDLTRIADATGYSINQLVPFAATLQDTFVPLGFAREAAADLSTELVQLSIDLASFNNLNTADVINDIQSALVGNTETLRKYGVVANETSIKAKALELGLWDGAGAMDAQTKAASILQILLDGTADAQGDAERTAESYANRQKALESATLDLQVALGDQLIPAVTAGTEALILMAKAGADLLTNNEGLLAFFQNLAAGAKALFGGYERDIVAMIAGNIAAADSTEDLIGVLVDLQENSKDITFFSLDAIPDAVDTIAAKLAFTTDNFAKFYLAMSDANNLAIETTGEGIEALEPYLELSLEELEITYHRLRAQGELIVGAEIAARATESLTGKTEELALSERELAGTSYQVAAGTEAMYGAMLDAETVAGIVQGSMGDISGSVDDLMQAYQDLEDNQVSYYQYTVNNSREVAEVSEQLASDLTDDQRDAYQDILRTVDEGSAEWLAAWDALQGDLTESQRYELVAQVADMQQAHGQMQTAMRGDAEAVEEAQKRIDEAFAAISESHRQMVVDILIKQAEMDGGFNQSIANTMVALGLMTEEEAALRLEIENTKDAIADMSTQMLQTFLEDGAVSRQEAELLAGAVKLIEEKGIGAEMILWALANGTLPALIGTLETSSTRTGDLKSQLEEISGTYDVVVKFETDTSGWNPPYVPGPGDPGYVPGNNPPQYFASGGYTGNMPSSQVAGIVHGQEYVFSAPAVGAIGVPALEAMHAQALYGGFNYTENNTGGDTIHISVRDDAQAMMVNEIIRQERRRTRRQGAFG